MRYYAFLLTNFAFVLLMVNGEIEESIPTIIVQPITLPIENNSEFSVALFGTEENVEEEEEMPETLPMGNGWFSEADSAVPVDINLLPMAPCEEGCLEHDHPEPVEEEGMTKVLVYWREDNFYQTENGPAIADEMLKSVTEFLGTNCATPTKNVGMQALEAIGETILTGIPTECALNLSTMLKEHQDIKYAEPEESAQIFM